MISEEEREELYDRCYECTGYGDDYILDDSGEWVPACDECYVMERLCECD